MREIKFRAWDKCKSKMCSVDFIKFSKVQHTQIIFSYREENKIVYQDSSLLDENMFGTCVLMQYTGLKDKNDIEIYEYSELDGTYEVVFKDLKYNLRHISNNDIIDLHDYWRGKNGEIEVTREYTKV